MMEVSYEECAQYSTLDKTTEESFKRIASGETVYLSLSHPVFISLSAFFFAIGVVITIEAVQN